MPSRPTQMCVVITEHFLSGVLAVGAGPCGDRLIEWSELVAALVHDVGYAVLGHRKHEVTGARVMLRRRGFHSGKVRRVRGALDHHIDFNNERKPSLVGRILRIVEDYDHFSTQGEGDGPARALAMMAGGAGTLYDPDLMQVFVNSMGRYPPGTVLKIGDGRRVRSVSLVRSPQTFNRPLVMTDAGELIDLAQ